MQPVRAAASPDIRADGTSALIHARGLSKTYTTNSGQITALKDLDFSIYEGEFVSVVGPTGPPCDWSAGATRYPSDGAVISESRV